MKNNLTWYQDMRKGVHFIILLLILFSSCIDKDVYQGEEETDNGDGNGNSTEYVRYLYPYGAEAQDVVAEITIETNGGISWEDVEVEIPFLKYNKSWLFMLTQDDFSHSSYSTTWAAINGRPLSNDYFYNAEQLAAGDLPPHVSYLGKTLGSTDGAGKEVRFHFTATVAPEMNWMDAEVSVNKGFSDNNYRFQMMRGLTWNNLSEMLAYGTGIAFHDVNTKDADNAASILQHYEISQQILLEKLSGRGCKTLAEPNGNKAYVRAALDYAPLQIMTAQNDGGGEFELESLYPFKVNSDLHKGLLQRYFYDSPFDIVPRIEAQLRKDKVEREAVHFGVHRTGITFAQFLLWLNNRYGKDGDDSVWFPSLEEYYEYNYYRVNATIEKEVNGNTVTLRVSLPSEQYFYYPSITINLPGVREEQIKSVTSGNEVTGLSYANYNDGLMLNIDCRKFLAEHALYFVEKYESSRSQADKNDALYFTNMLKEAPEKFQLLERIK